MKKQTVIDFYEGSQSKVARALGIKQPSVAEWEEIIPESSATKLHVITDGKLRYDPAIYSRPPIKNRPSTNKKKANKSTKQRASA